MLLQAGPSQSVLDRIVTSCLGAGKFKVLTVVALMTALIAIADWSIGLDISLAGLYMLPMVLAATVVSPFWIVMLALTNAVLRWLFESPRTHAIEVVLRLLFAVVAYASSGLAVVAVMRSRQSQVLRAVAEEQLKTLVESSAAGILTLDGGGRVLAANRAANELFALGVEERMEGRNIYAYLPVLADALQMNSELTPFRTAVQGQGQRDDGEPFLADIWFSTYSVDGSWRMSAIVIDSSEELRAREEHTLRQLSLNNRIMAGAMLHEVRNLCSAIAIVYSNVDKSSAHPRNELKALDHLVQGLARIASQELTPVQPEAVGLVSLRDVLNDLRIILEPTWAEGGGALYWKLPDEMPRVVADRHGLLQVFLNLAQNSQRAVRHTPVRELHISVAKSAERAFVRFEDTGCGVQDPQRLFHPFQEGADSTGLGLYISRSLLRTYGGELRFDPQCAGAVFLVELQQVP